MSDREKFEAWMATLDEAESVSWSIKNGMEGQDAAALIAWQAGWRAALEKAALFMESRALTFENGTHIGDTMARIYRDEADSIRSLANGDKS